MSLVTKITLSGRFGLFNQYLLNGHNWNLTTKIPAILNTWCKWTIEYEDLSQEDIVRSISTAKLDDLVRSLINSYEDIDK